MSAFWATLIYIFEACLCVFDENSDYIHELFLKSQRLLNTWHDDLNMIRGCYKLNKWHWTLQDFAKNTIQFELILDAACSLTISYNEITLHIMNSLVLDAKVTVGIIVTTSKFHKYKIKISTKIFF